MRVLHRSTFFHDGRGPTLVAVHLWPGGAHLEAIDFRSPDSEESPAPLRHLRFVKAQSFMFTPEEVENYGSSSVDWSATEMGALISLGKSSWLNSFSQRHLERCEHFRAMFYDEFLDVICESIEVCEGAFVHVPR